MPKFLIDANLPYYFSLWKGENFVHQKDIDDTWTDGQIWEYAKKQGLTILSKDSDFSDRIVLTEPPPKVIHIRLGNMRMPEFFKIMTAVWDKVEKMNQEYKLVQVFRDRIEGIN